MNNTSDITGERQAGSKLLAVKQLRIGFAGAENIVKDVSMAIDRGEIVGLSGPSGAGKSLTLWSLIGLLPHNSRMTGRISLYNARGAESLVFTGDSKNAHDLRRKIRTIPQNPFTSLNPVMRCGLQIAEMPDLKGFGKAEKEQKILTHLQALGFEDPERVYQAYPFELSGGQLQRIVIAMATLGEPDLILADEPTTALDVRTQKEVLDLLKVWITEKQKSLLIVSHDTRLLSRYCDRIYAMRDGRIIGEPEVTAPPATMAGEIQPQSEGLVPSKDTLCSLIDVEVRYKGRSGRTIQALKNVSFGIHKHEVLGIAGATGCGKSTIAKVLTGLVEPNSGQVLFQGRRLDYDIDRGLRKQIQMVFQDPYSALYPHQMVGAYLREAVRWHKITGRSQEDAAISAILKAVGLPEAFASRYPHQLSGGERQRVQIARALLIAPELLICDEITSGLDGPVQRQIIALLSEMHREKGMSIVMISHDLSVLKAFTSRILVMEAGTIVEVADTPQIFRNPQHEVTQTLVRLSETGALW